MSSEATGALTEECPFLSQLRRCLNAREAADEPAWHGPQTCKLTHHHFVNTVVVRASAAP